MFAFSADAMRSRTNRATKDAREPAAHPHAGLPNFKAPAATTSRSPAPPSRIKAAWATLEERVTAPRWCATRRSARPVGGHLQHQCPRRGLQRAVGLSRAATRRSPPRSRRSTSQSGALSGQYKEPVSATLDRVRTLRRSSGRRSRTTEKRSRLAAGARLYHRDSTAALLALGRRTTLGAQSGDARRLLLSRLRDPGTSVSAPQDPLSLGEVRAGRKKPSTSSSTTRPCRWRRATALFDAGTAGLRPAS